MSKKTLIFLIALAAMVSACTGPSDHRFGVSEIRDRGNHETRGNPTNNDDRN